MSDLALLTIGWKLVENAEAVAAAERARADTARNEAEQNAAEARRQRDRAEHNFRMAREAVDELLTRISTPDQQPQQVRQELLRAAKQ